MNIRVEYSRDEVDRIVLDKHLNSFGPPPAGEQWQCTGVYGDRTIENVPIRAPEADAACPPPNNAGVAQQPPQAAGSED